MADGIAFCYDKCVINECSQMVRRSFLGLCKLGGHLLKTGRKKRDVLFEISLNCALQLNIKIRALLTAKRASKITVELATLRVKEKLYLWQKIITKDVGWFPPKERRDMHPNVKQKCTKEVPTKANNLQTMSLDSEADIFCVNPTTPVSTSTKRQSKPASPRQKQDEFHV